MKNSRKVCTSTQTHAGTAPWSHRYTPPPPPQRHARTPVRRQQQPQPCQHGRAALPRYLSQACEHVVGHGARELRQQRAQVGVARQPPQHDAVPAVQPLDRRRSVRSPVVDRELQRVLLVGLRVSRVRAAHLATETTTTSVMQLTSHDKSQRTLKTYPNWPLPITLTTRKCSAPLRLPLISANTPDSTTAASTASPPPAATAAAVAAK
jgi:hypothetical protein